jgi:prephenate dehydrogenase
MADCGVAVVCTPVGCIPGLVRELTAGDGDAVITDVGSTKGALCSELADLAGSGRYVGSHPMCGSHLTGLENADPDLYEGALCVVTPLPESPEQAVARVETLWSGVGGRLWRCSPGAHDDAVAEASHLPHILSAATARLLGDNGLPLAATGFRDTSRVAAGAPGLWRDILMENREAVRRELGRAKDLLSELDRALGDGAAVEAWLSRAAERRRAFDERD